MKNLKKLLALGLVTSMSMGVLVACGDSKSSGDGDKVELTMSIWDNNQKPVVEEQIKMYEAQNEGVNITVQVTPFSEYWTKLEASAVGGTAPDIFWLNVLHTDAYYDGGILLDLTESAQEANIQEDYPKELVNAYIKEEKNIALPKDFDTTALWYNKEIFDKAGIAYPTDDWTDEDLLNTAKELKESGLDEGVYPFACPVNSQQWYYPSIYAYDGWIINEDGTETGYAETGTIEGVQLWVDMMEEGISPTTASLGETNENAMFGAGQLAMVLAGSYMTPEYMKNESLDGIIDLVEFPMINDVEPNVINGLGNAVYAGTKHEEEAVKFVTWLSGEEAMKIQGESGTVISARNDAQEYFLNTNLELNLQAYLTHVDDAKPLPAFDRVAELFDLEKSMFNLAYSGEMTVEEACTQLKEETDALLAP